MLDMFVGFFMGALIGCGLTWNYMNTKLWGMTRRLQELGDVLQKGIDAEEATDAK